jgi:type II secretory pathway pseudopilin PulG
MLNLSSTRAFTIIEFLVVFGIIGMVTMLSIASYTTFTESYKLKNEVQNAIAVLSLAQKRAVAGEDISAHCSSCSFDSVVVTFTADWGYTMQGQYVTNADPTTRVPYDSPVSYSIDVANKNIVILDTKTVAFNKLTGAPDGADTVTFKNNVKDECTQIGITTVGLISSTNIDCP